jgi:hypothetical protein
MVQSFRFLLLFLVVRLHVVVVVVVSANDPGTVPTTAAADRRLRQLRILEDVRGGVGDDPEELGTMHSPWAVGQEEIRGRQGGGGNGNNSNDNTPTGISILGGAMEVAVMVLVLGGLAIYACRLQSRVNELERGEMYHEVQLKDMSSSQESSQEEEQDTTEEEDVVIT